MTTSKSKKAPKSKAIAAAPVQMQGGTVQGKATAAPTITPAPVPVAVPMTMTTKAMQEDLKTKEKRLREVASAATKAIGDLRKLALNTANTAYDLAHKGAFRNARIQSIAKQGTGGRVDAIKDLAESLGKLTPEAIAKKGNKIQQLDRFAADLASSVAVIRNLIPLMQDATNEFLGAHKAVKARVKSDEKFKKEAAEQAKADGKAMKKQGQAIRAAWPYPGSEPKSAKAIVKETKKETKKAKKAAKKAINPPLVTGRAVGVVGVTDGGVAY